MEKNLNPALGRLPIDTITTPELLACLRRIENRGAIDTAHRAHQVAGQVFRYAIQTGRTRYNPTTDLKGALKSPKVKHHAAITDPKEVGKLLRAIDIYSGSMAVRTILQLSPLFFCRPGELRQMEWKEIDWEKSLWEIPTHKMKMGAPHIVPLCSQAVQILQDYKPYVGNSEYVFPSPRGHSRPLSDNAVRIALRNMGYDKETMSAHGFRAMARTILDEVLEFRVEWIEHQLAHSVKDANGRAYNRTSFLPQRTDMMQKWGDYLDTLKAG